LKRRGAAGLEVRVLGLRVRLLGLTARVLAASKSSSPKLTEQLTCVLATATPPSSAAAARPPDSASRNRRCSSDRTQGLRRS